MVKKVAKMGYFCPIFWSILLNLGLFLRGFHVRGFCLNIQEGGNVKIQNLFLFIPYRTLGKSCIEMSFWSILEVFWDILAKVANLATFRDFLTKSAQFCQKEMTKMPVFDPIGTLVKPNKNTLAKKVVHFLTGFRPLFDEF